MADEQPCNIILTCIGHNRKAELNERVKIENLPGGGSVTLEKNTILNISDKPFLFINTSGHIPVGITASLTEKDRVEHGCMYEFPMRSDFIRFIE